MKKIVKTLALGTLLLASNAYAMSVTGCTGCHGQHFEKAAMGKSKVVKDMSLKDIIASLKGYKDGTYGDSMKQMMVSQVKHLKDKDIEAMSLLIKTGSGSATDHATEFASAAAVAKAGGSLIDLNEDASDALRIEREDLANVNYVSERALGLRKTNLYDEKTALGSKTDYSRPAPGASTRFERAYHNAPPMIPHSVEGLLPITKMNNQCVGCHMPEVAPAMGATAIPQSHFTDYRPEIKYKDGKVIKEGKVWGKDWKNTTDIKLAEARKTDHMNESRFNCTQCHAPQSKTRTDVANTFRPDFKNTTYKAHSTLAEAMNEGIDIEVEEKSPFKKGKK